MIKISSVQQEEATITDAYLTDDHSAVMISNTFSDYEADEKYRCYEFSEYGVVMVSNEGVWTDFEVMTPEVVDDAPCSFKSEIATQHGFPYVQVTGKSCKVCVQKLSGSFVLWFERDMQIDSAVINDSATFYCSADQLVGISIASQ